MTATLLTTSVAHLCAADFTTWASDHPSSFDGAPPDAVTLQNPSTGGRRTYRYERPVYHGTGDDRELAGWKYTSPDGGTLTVYNT